ncbi:MAG: hypothetical protein GX826_01730, partial [Gammaproteobacteria bacterium]|nr:hypothetical protein [Gammaproteobacteria bacterium]
VQVGDRLSLMSKGEALIDPETGISLGSQETEIGSVEVTSVQDRFSIARLTGGKLPKTGDIVRSHRAPSQLVYANLDPALTKKPGKRRNSRR